MTGTHGPGANLGLPPDRVTLLDHDPDWAAAFERDAHEIRAALEGILLDVQHIGSTAVPGLPAKPILDIAIALSRAEDGTRCVEPLAALGYGYVGDTGAFGGHLFQRVAERDGETVTTHHLHAVARDDPQWIGYLTLRDHLRSSPAARDAYRARKLDLAARHPDDRQAYLEGKTRVILELIAEGLKEKP